MKKSPVNLDLLAEAIENGPVFENDSLPNMHARVTQLILILILGVDAANQLCLSPSQERRFDSARGYLRMDKREEDTPKHEIERFARMTRLAQGLFNTQHIDGFDKIVGDIRFGGVQSAFEELAFASLLVQRHVPFRFLHPSSITRQKTPDIEIVLDGVTIYCEVEGKLEETPATAGSIRNTLEHARKQLPSGQPGLIFLKIPESWKGEPAIPAVFRTIEDFFRQASRVVSVIVMSERHTPTSAESDGKSASILFLRRNLSSKLLKSEVNAALDRIWNFRPKLIGGVPLGVLAIILRELNTARARFLADGYPASGFPDVRMALLAGFRNELLQKDPPILI